MECRAGCASCCIIPSISSPIPGMPQGKPPFTRCIQLTDEGLCALFEDPSRPAVCKGIKPDLSWCGTTTQEANALISALECETSPLPMIGQTDSH